MRSSRLLLFSVIDERTAVRFDETLDRQLSAGWPHDERRALDTRDQHPGARRERDVGATDREPSFAGKFDVAHASDAADEIERDHLLANEPSMHTAGVVRTVACEQRGAHPWPDQADATDRQQHSGDQLRGDGAGSEHGDQRSREAADGREQGIEREMVKLDREEHHARSDPYDDQAVTFLLRRKCTTLREDGPHGGSRARAIF